MDVSLQPSRCSISRPVPALVAMSLAAGASTASAGEMPAAVAPAPATLPATSPTVEELTTPVARVLSIDAAVQEALRRNPTLEDASAAIRRAQAVLAEARALSLPRLDGDARFTLQGPIPTFTFTQPSTMPGQPGRSQEISFGKPFTRSFSIAGTYEVDVVGRQRFSREAAGRGVNVARGAFYQTQNELVYAVQNIYIAALRARELIGVYEEALRNAQEQLRVAQAQLRAGTAPEFDVLRASVQVANVRQNQVAAAATHRRTLANLVQLLGVDPQARLELVPLDLPPEPDAVALAAAREALEPGPAAPQPERRPGDVRVPPGAPDPGGALPRTLEAALSEAFSRRPEVYRAEWARRAAESRARLQRTGNLPSVGLTAGFAYNPDQAGLAVETQSWSLVANVTIPIWDAGLTRARARQAQADVASAAAQLRQAQDVVAQEVKQAQIDLEEAAQRRRAASANTAQAREALRVARVRYNAGLAPNVEVTDAEAALTLARSNEVNASYDSLSALASLNRALGRYAVEALAQILR